MSKWSLVLTLAVGCMPSIAQPKQARSADSFVDTIGVNTHLSYIDTVYSEKNYQRINQLLPDLGVRHIRDGLILSIPQKFDASYYYNQLNYLALKHGIRSTLTNGHSITTIIQEPELAHTLGRISASVIAITGPNELDNGSIPDWPDHLKATQRILFESARKYPTQTQLAVIGPSLIHRANFQQLGSLSEHLDYGDMHSYPGANPPTYGLDEWLVTVRAVSGMKPLVVTETGYNTGTKPGHKGQPGVSEMAASKYLPRLFLEYFNRGIHRTFMYEFLDEGADPKQSENFYGLVRHDGTLKPSYIVLKRLIALLQDPGLKFKPGTLNFSLFPNTAQIHFTLLQKHNQTFYLILWQEVPSYSWKNYANNDGYDLKVPTVPIRLLIKEPMLRAQVYLPNRSLKPILELTKPQQIALEVPDYPLVVKLTPDPNP